MLNNEEVEAEVKTIESPKEETNPDPLPIKSNKQAKAPKQEKTKCEPALEPNEPLIDFAEITKKSRDLKNSEILLAIIEIATNPQAYGLSGSIKSRPFWDKLNDISEFKKILAIFKTETLRKYWRLLSEISSQKKVVDLITRHRETINQTALKPLTIISYIKEHLTGNLDNFEASLLECPERAYAVKSHKKREAEEESFDEVPKKLLNNKRGKSFETNNNPKNDQGLDRQKEVETANSKKPQKSRGYYLFTEEDKSIFKDIDVIVEGIKNQVPEVSDLEIWEALKKNSFSIIKTYQYLVNVEKHEGRIKLIYLLSSRLF